MNKKHEKSVCCRARYVRFGVRRRQCVSCKRTWRVWRKKLGRKRKRGATEFVENFLNREIASLSSLARKRGYSESYVQKKLKRSRDSFILKTAWSPMPEGGLIAIADAVVELVEKRWRTVHLILVRQISGDSAVILPPFIRNGTETCDGWRQAFEQAPREVLARIQALVCDGHRGLVNEGHWRKWVMQRCHFHLLARIQSRRSRWQIARHKEEAETIFKNIHLVLENDDKKEIAKALNLLEEIGWLSTSPEIRKVLSGFVNNYVEFRSYLIHPKLNLPTTNNTAESLASSIADLKHRMRGFPTMESFTQWIIALLKFKKTLKCRGRNQPRKVG